MQDLLGSGEKNLYLGHRREVFGSSLLAIAILLSWKQLGAYPTLPWEQCFRSCPTSSQFVDHVPHRTICTRMYLWLQLCCQITLLLLLQDLF